MKRERFKGACCCRLLSDQKLTIDKAQLTICVTNRNQIFNFCQLSPVVYCQLLLRYIQIFYQVFNSLGTLLNLINKENKLRYDARLITDFLS